MNNVGSEVVHQSAALDDPPAVDIDLRGQPLDRGVVRRNNPWEVSDGVVCARGYYLGRGA
jgi:hypothetical protein